MKRGLVRLGFFMISFLFILSFILSPLVHSEDVITSKVITGKATSPINTSISVAGAMIYSPREGGVYGSVSILFNYSVITPNNISSVWYSLDGVNTSLGNFSSNYIYFNTTEGNKTIYLYANDTAGLTFYRSVDFYVNNTIKLVVIYDTFKGAYRGNSSDFDVYNNDVLENFPNMTLENTNYGKIIWNDRINLSNDSNPSDWVTTLDYNVVIANQSIFVNTIELPNLNKSAILWFYNLTLSNPRVLANGVLCPSEICSGKTYSNGVLTFTVTGFFNFTVEETPAIPQPPSVSGGGGGGGALGSNIVIDKEKILVSLKQGETKRGNFTVKNTGNKKMRMNLSVAAIGDLIKLNETNFELSPGESKTIGIDFIAREDTTPDLYMGKILVEEEGIEKEILVAIEVESNQPLFDVQVNIPKGYQQVLPGGELLATIKLYNLGKTGKVDVKVQYQIRDDKNNAVLDEEETVAVETQTSFVKEFQLPEGTKPGTYILYIKANYDDQVGSASVWFSVKEKPFMQTDYFLYLLVILILIVLAAVFIIIYQILKLKSKFERERRIDEYLLAKENIVKPKNEN